MNPTTLRGMELARLATSEELVVRRRFRAQRGAALLIMLGALVLLTAAILLSQLNASVVPTPTRDPSTSEALASAKDALIAWAATHPDTPGLLPFPDRNDDVTPDYDGAADCVAPGTVGPAHLIGSFPIRGEELLTGCTADVPMSVEIEDSSGQRLWYAVSRNLVRGGGGGLVNPDIGELGLHPWITVRDQSGTILSSRVAAVIIAPGTPLVGQDRSSIAPAAANYLDSFVIGATTYDNADADGCPDALTAPCVATPGEEFIINPSPAAGDNFNDRLVFVTIDELMGAVQDRVIGEAANALKNYRGTGDVYPWLSPFSDPRAKLEGTATGGSATSLVDLTMTDFAAAGVVVGDLVRNLTDGSARTVTAVAPTTLTLFSQGLIGGATNIFAAGDDYVVHTSNKFDGTASNVDGMLPIAFPGKLFQTGFSVNWNFFGGVDSTETWNDGDIGLIPTIIDVENFNGATLPVTFPNGLCKWIQTDRIDCMGTATLPNTPAGGTTRTVEVWFNFTADTTTIVPPTGATGRRRNHTFIGNNGGPVTPLLAPDLPQNAWSVHIEDDNGTNRAYRRAARVPGTNLDVTITGIHYEDLDVPGDLPRWFVDNKWHHFVHVALSGANAPTSGTTTGSGTCLVPPAGDATNQCLTVRFSGTMVRPDVAALVIGPGTMLTAQDRITATTPCSGQSPPKPAIFCDYFEGPNSNDESPSRNLTFGRTPSDTFSVTTTFNDHVRAVPP